MSKKPANNVSCDATITAENPNGLGGQASSGNIQLSNVPPSVIAGVISGLHTAVKPSDLKPGYSHDSTTTMPDGSTAGVNVSCKEPGTGMAPPKYDDTPGNLPSPVTPGNGATNKGQGRH
jgi:hypothetical protein